MDKMSFLWLILFITFLVVEAVTVVLTSIWFAVGALLSLVLSLAGASITVQVVVFVVISIVLMIFTKPILSKYLLGKREKTNYESVMGQKVKVTEQINNIENKGTVMINGLEWTAKTEDGSVVEKDEIVEVVKVEGVKAIVRK